jgi:hypothetical protein
MNWQDTLRGADAGMGTSADVEARLRAEVRALGRARRRQRVMVLAMAATVMLAVAAVAWFRIGPGRADVAPEPVVTASREVTTGYYPLFYASLPTRGTHVVRLEVPRAALNSFGLAALDVVVARPSGTVLADVVIGDDGLARAVRFVHSPISQE